MPEQGCQVVRIADKELKFVLFCTAKNSLVVKRKTACFYQPAEVLHILQLCGTKLSISASLRQLKEKLMDVANFWYACFALPIV